VTSISPNHGTHSGGTAVSIHGTGFVPGTTVKFGTTAAGTVTFVSPTLLTVAAPAHAVGAVHIRVTTAAGTSPATGADSYTYQ
jgi:IPT/TIG domain